MEEETQKVKIFQHSGKLSIEEWMDGWQLNPTKIRKLAHMQQSALLFTLHYRERSRCHRQQVSVNEEIRD